MLGQYREYSNGQAGAIEHVRMFTYICVFSYPRFGHAVVEGYGCELKEITMVNSFSF